LRELGRAELRVAGRDANPHLREALSLSRTVGDMTASARALALGLLWSGRVPELEDLLDPTLSAVAAHDPEQAVQLEAEVLSGLIPMAGSGPQSTIETGLSKLTVLSSAVRWTNTHHAWQ
jgi:hypothetical protein